MEEQRAHRGGVAGISRLVVKPRPRRSPAKGVELGWRRSGRPRRVPFSAETTRSMLPLSGSAVEEDRASHGPSGTSQPGIVATRQGVPQREGWAW